jgi:hypothetical protein
MKSIKIETGQIRMDAVLNDSSTAEIIYNALPLEGRANIWGDEIYFDIPISLGQEPDARAEVEIGEIAYWPAGSALCIFFGPTPASKNNKPKAYSPVNVCGNISGDARIFKKVSQGDIVKVF